MIVRQPVISSAKIVFECQNLTLGSGTGIATYARNLAAEAKQLGFRTAGLFGVQGSIVARNTALNEVQLFDARPRDHRGLAGIAVKAMRLVHRDPFGVKPQQISRNGIVVDPGSAIFSEEFDEAAAVPEITERSREHFCRYGRLMPVANTLGADIFHMTHAIPMQMRKTPSICTIHDIIPLRLPYTTLDNKRYFYDLIKSLVNKLDHIVTVSEHSRKDLIKFFDIPEHRISNTYQSVSIPASILAMSDDDIARDIECLYGLQYKNYFLFVGAIEPKKNVTRLIDAYSASGSNRSLILAGGLGWQYDGDVQRMNDERFRRFRIEGQTIRQDKIVQHLSYLPRANLLKLMRGARALIFPSLYEGFGLPVLEAMLLRTAVITSTSSSLPEVAGEAALLADPTDVSAIARAIHELDQDNDLVEALAARGAVQSELFSPARYRARLSTLYKSIL